MDTWKLVAEERRRLADDLENLTDEQWAAQSNCDKWNVKQASAHIIMPLVTSTPRFLFTMLKNRRNLDNTILELTARVDGANSREEIIAALRAQADNQWKPPGRGPEIPLTEIVVHGQDIRRALGIDHNIPAETITHALDGIDDAEIKADYASRIGV